jgi:hypothetical protein
MEIIDQLQPGVLEPIREWCRRQPLGEVTKSSYVKGRLEKWYRMGSNLQSIHLLGRARVFQCEEAPLVVNYFGDLHLKGWNSLLVCGGPTTITWHRDHGHFFGPAVMINLGEATYHESDRNADINTPTAIKFQNYHLEDGMVVWIDTKMPHASTQISAERFNLTFRTIKPEYLAHVYKK